MNKTLVRDATPTDETAWRQLWQGFLGHYDITLPEATTAFTWARLMDPTNSLAARLVEVDGRVLGFALHQHHPSSWVMGDDCYLEDLYVAPEARGRGLGAALIEDLIALARGRGWKRIYWHTEADNHAARALYDRYAADDGHVRYRTTL